MSAQITPLECTRLIREYDFPVQKKYGQNFITDPGVLEAIVRASGITKEDVVLEIGPGMGALTSYLLKAAQKVIAVEIDRMLIPILKDTLKDYDNLVLINDDILKTDLDSLIASEAGGKKIKVAANLPYYITTPVVMELLEKQKNIESITVMVQKEVAERMQTGPGSKAYGALSLAVQYYSKPEIFMTVSKNCFVPRPEVDSAVINLDIYEPENRPVRVKDEEKMFKIIRAAFNQRRKTLPNSLANAASLNFSKAEVNAALEKMGLPLTIRGEALTLEEFARLSDLL